jgi:plasmid stabilization system protein ParE
MKLSVITLPEAEADIYRSAQWWAAHRSAEQALRWWNGIWPVIDSLAERPEQWPLAAESDDFPFEIRERHYGLGSTPSHRIIFTIRVDQVYVLAVPNTAEDRLRPSDVAPLP